MIFVDTNYFLRFLTGENQEQYEKTKLLFRQAAEAKEELFSSTVVFFEIYWVLTSFYEKQKSEALSAMENILSMKFILFPEREILENALIIFSRETISLEDSYNLTYAKKLKAKDFATFDQKLKKLFV